ncbi:MAG: hypothetical protein E6G20_06570 [Actinobacteria bacterium]|nr:MAG: hypothetical protein E6G20_06570 [Actinomycetota bacterium]
MMVIGRGIESREKEGNMSKRLASGLGAVLALAAVFAVWVVGSAAAGKAACGTVVLNEQAWAGSTANTYVAKYVLEKNFGCTVKVTQITEIPVYQAMASGKVDAVLEDWQHVAQYKQFVTKQKTVVLVGSNGLQGHIGWFIPKYLLKQYPQFKTWKGLKGKETVFKSPESGSQGMFLGGDPSYEQKDTQLIQALGLNFKHVTVGAEPAEVARFTQTIKQHKPVIFYWWTPQYLNKNLDLAEVPGRCERGRQRQAVPLRVCDLPAREALQQEVRDERLPRRELPEEVALAVECRPELRRQPHRRPAHGSRQGSGDMDQGAPGIRQDMAREVGA